MQMQKTLQQCGGSTFKNPSPKHTLTEDARLGAQEWVNEVKAVKRQQGVTFKEALTVASERRQRNIPGYKTVEERYLNKLKESRKSPDYRFSGAKNKRPVTFSAAEAILKKYYTDRADQFKKGPLSAMRKKIASCPKKHPERVLIACKADLNGRPIVTSECANSWKYRPGRFAKAHTGPGIYDIHGLDDLCGEQNQEARKESKLYNKKRLINKKK